MSRWQLRLVLLLQSLLYGFAFSFLTGLIPEWGRWYSLSPYYSAQVEALLHGRFALSHSVADLGCDLAWSEGGVHQVWGLGVPFLRLPLVALGHLFGCKVFPEQIATALAFSFTAFLVLLILIEPAIWNKEPPAAALPKLGCALLLLSFPPLVSMLKARFLIYEEAVAHAYLYGIVEALLLLAFLRKPSQSGWLILMSVAGLGAFVRPPLVFYGFAAWCVGTLALLSLFKVRTPASAQPFVPSTELPPVQLERLRRSLSILQTIRLWRTGLGLDNRNVAKTWLRGTGLFGFGIGALLLTNWLRFGSPGEFGHKLNFQPPSCAGASYASKFDHPFETAPFPAVARELIGWLFFAKPASDPNDYYKPNLFWGQAGTVRLRELAFSSYDWTYLPLLAVAAALLVYWLWLGCRRRLGAEDALLTKLGLWCVVSLVPIGWFYLRMLGVCSRYTLDFAPGFVVLTAIGWYGITKRLSRIWRFTSIAALGVWLGWQIASAQSTSTFVRGVVREDLSTRPRFGQTDPSEDASRVGTESSKAGSSGLPFDGTGWNSRKSETMPIVCVLVKDPEFLELELTRAANAKEDPDPAWVRAKIGLEWLERESVVRDGHLWRIRFKGPRRAQYCTGVQTVNLALVPNTHLADQTTSWALVKVRWRAESATR